jgi:hypothetical protein
MSIVDRSSAMRTPAAYYVRHGFWFCQSDRRTLHPPRSSRVKRSSLVDITPRSWDLARLGLCVIL